VAARLAVGSLIYLRDGDSPEAMSLNPAVGARNEFAYNLGYRFRPG